MMMLAKELMRNITLETQGKRMIAVALAHSLILTHKSECVENTVEFRSVLRASNGEGICESGFLWQNQTWYGAFSEIWVRMTLTADVLLHRTTGIPAGVLSPSTTTAQAAIPLAHSFTSSLCQPAMNRSPAIFQNKFRPLFASFPTSTPQI